MTLVDEIAGNTLPPGARFQGPPVLHQRNVVRGQISWPFALPCLLDCLGLPGHHGSCDAPLCTVVFAGMLASTWLAVRFVPTFFVVIQRFENWLAERKARKAGASVAPPAPGTVH